MSLLSIAGLPVLALIGMSPAALETRGLSAASFEAAPFGYVQMCIEQPALCNSLAADNSGPIATDTRAQWKLLRGINARVNRTIRQRDDRVTMGRESWDRPDASRGFTGDCEDLAIEKRLQLIDAGFPADDLSFAVGYRHGLGLHAVLVARIDERLVVLDSRTSAIVGWRHSPYSWVSLQQPGRPAVWRPAYALPDVVIARADAVQGHAALHTRT